MTRARGRAWRRAGLALLLVTAVLLSLLLLFPLPRSILSPAMERSSGWLLTDGKGGGSLGQAARRLVGLELQLSLAAQAYRSQRLPPGLSDAQRIAARLSAVKGMMIDQTELPHDPVGAPAGVAGLAYCDSLNGFAAAVLSHEFDEIGLVAVDDPDTGARHSFGRLRSPREGWLYFDIWTSRVAVFRSLPGRAAEYLVLAPVPSTRPLDPEVARILERLHNGAHAGILHNRSHLTLGGYVADRLTNWLRHGDTAPAGAQDSLGTAAGRTGRRDGAGASGWPGWGRVDSTRQTIAAAAYGRARSHHMLGEVENARAAYAEVLRQEGGTVSIYGQAARIFLQRLASDGSRVAATY